MSRRFHHFIISSFILCLPLTSCYDPDIYNGNKIVPEPTEETIDMPLVLYIEACNGTIQAGNHLVLDSSDTISITGWAFGPENKTLAKLILHVGNHHIAANYGFYRADVQNVMQSDEKAYGYMFCFARSLMPNASNGFKKEMELIGITKDGKKLNPVLVTFDLAESPNPKQLPQSN